MMPSRVNARTPSHTSVTDMIDIEASQQDSQQLRAATERITHLRTTKGWRHNPYGLSVTELLPWSSYTTGMMPSHSYASTSCHTTTTVVVDIEASRQYSQHLRAATEGGTHLRTTKGWRHNPYGRSVAGPLPRPSYTPPRPVSVATRVVVPTARLQLLHHTLAVWETEYANRFTTANSMRDVRRAMHDVLRTNAADWPGLVLPDGFEPLITMSRPSLMEVVQRRMGKCAFREALRDVRRRHGITSNAPFSGTRQAMQEMGFFCFCYPSSRTPAITSIFDPNDERVAPSADVAPAWASDPEVRRSAAMLGDEAIGTLLQDRLRDAEHRKAIVLNAFRMSAEEEEGLRLCDGGWLLVEPFLRKRIGRASAQDSLLEHMSTQFKRRVFHDTVVDLAMAERQLRLAQEPDAAALDQQEHDTRVFIQHEDLRALLKRAREGPQAAQYNTR